ncbi:MAG: Chromosome partition protein smc [uncultured Acidimicrobiales bacterium]|uniref:Chromosome partition protein Smc n=1 Tax=uncultured Acidimicrobiales bacterium TaxID=310071 RepID=A0A6J4HWI8_9ACTN|nr:MAG: Chromosome partition protein smc [uncultured Acidimicrobiales bacterium]
MFLRSLTLKGFKSFADPTTLDLEPGLTAVVGPNGSGKSNIVDAVAWVLGAQGPRSVRSTRMDDVIFAGTGRRSALGRAEVTLTIDNTAGLLPIGLSEVTITRTLFRTSGESEYAINGAPCRLLDVQELLSDTGVGRQQHVIVSQGNLDTVLDARPEDRRLIIEEAAGILKFRRRKEKAERRLEATEANLVRLADLNREVGRQLKPLERQADAARRHDALAAELRALRLHLAGRELAALTARRHAAATARTGLAADEASIKVELRGLDSSVAAAEAWVASAGGSSLGDAVGRLEALRERARGLAALLNERQRSLGRDRAVAVDATVISTLESDAARLATELTEVTAEAAPLAPLRAELAEAEAAVARELDGLTVPKPRRDRAAEARGELAAVGAGADRGRAEMARLQDRLVSLEALTATLDGQATDKRAEVEGLAGQERTAVAEADRADAHRADALARLEAAKAESRETAAAQRVWAARVDALALALADSAGTAGADRLAGVDGVLGPLAELVDVDRGWEDAWAAAAAELAHTVVVDGVAAARYLLDGLDEAGAGVLALGAPVPPRTAIPTGCPGEPLRAHVRSSHPGVEQALDVLLAGAVVVAGGWAEALDASLAHPEVVALTRSGDRFGATAWRRGNTGTAATRVALDEARTKAEESLHAAGAASGHLALVSTEAERAVAGAKQAAQEREVAVRAARQARADLDRAQTRRREALAEAEGVRSHLEQLSRRLAQEEARIAELAELLPVLEAEEAAGATEANRLAAARHEVQERMSALRSRRTELDMQATSLRDRGAYLTRRLADVEDRLARYGAERAAAGARRREIELLSVRTGHLAAFVDDRLGMLETELADVRARRERQSQALATASGRLEELRRRRHDAERRLEEVRERFRRAELDDAEARMRQEAAVESLRRELDCEPGAALSAECPVLRDGTSPASRVRELDRELRLMGPVNPLALEELSALRERHAFLSAQLDDVKGTRRELTKVIRAVETEMAQLLAAAYADVADHFVRLFETLFPGGQGRLRLTDPDNLLEAGIEVEARPAGKNVRKLSLLSGGERSLVALAFLFAVFRSRPSPFYLLDEVEAALDDVNLTRFLDLLGEFRQEAQLLVVTHQKRTMEAADCLYGVTMQPGGSSRVVSERVRANH